jgi:hypothetical protein
VAIDVSQIALAVAVGLGATFVMDAIAIVLKRAFNVPLPNMCLVGRWVRYMPEGVFMHDSIAKAPPKSAECIVGWIAHYVIGAIFAMVLVLLVSPAWLRQPTLLPPLIFGVVTVAIPFLVMHPSFGMGIAASKTPDPLQARLRSVVNHAIFGLGLYVSAVALSVLH